MRNNEDTPVYVGVGIAAVLVLALAIWFCVIPPYNKPIFEAIDNNETGFVVPQDEGTADQAHFESATYLKDKKVAAKRVQITRRWIQKGWLPVWGEYIDTVRLIKVNRSPVIREWTDELTSGTTSKDESLRAQSQDGTGLKLNFTATAYIPDNEPEHSEGAAEFLYYYKGDNLDHVMDKEVRARVQTVASEFTSKYQIEQLRGTQHKLAEAVREDVVPFFKKRGVAITNIGMVGGFHYVNKDIQQSIDEALAKQQMKVVALAQQEKEQVEQKTKLMNQKVNNDTMKLEAEGKAAALIAQAEGAAKAQLAAATVEAEAAKVRATGKANAVRIEAEAEGFKLSQLDKYRDLVLATKSLEIEGLWRSKWAGTVPQTIIQGLQGMVPLFPMDKVIPPQPMPHIPSGKREPNG